MWCPIALTAALLTVVSSQGCVQRRSKESGADDGHYCVCNATYCDSAPTVARSRFAAGYTLITSSKSGLRYHVQEGLFEQNMRHRPAAKILLDLDDRKQQIVGFGGAVTDSAALNIFSLTDQAADMLLESYFGTTGIEYNLIRTPIGATDFSERAYGYAPVENDTLLEHFTLQPEDYELKIPVIRRALELRENRIKLLASPWSPNPWLKTSHSWLNTAMIIKEYWPTYAKYFIKYLEGYQREGIPFWALTPQNEPMIHLYAHLPVVGEIWTAETEMEFIVDHLAPALENSEFRDVGIFVSDDTRGFASEWANVIFSNERARQVTAGTAVHWYYDNRTSPRLLDKLNDRFPEKMILYTEACNGVREAKPVILGSWRRGEAYAANIIEALTHWVSGWIDWNMVLNQSGGPTWLNNTVDAPVIVNAHQDEFYKQPMYYVMGHFSKYIPAGSWRVEAKRKGPCRVEHAAFTTPDNATVLVLLNTDDRESEVLVQDSRKGEARLSLPAKSISTMKYW